MDDNYGAELVITSVISLAEDLRVHDTKGKEADVIEQAVAHNHKLDDTEHRDSISEDSTVIANSKYNDKMTSKEDSTERNDQDDDNHDKLSNIEDAGPSDHLEEADVDYVAEPDYSPSVSNDYTESKAKLFNSEEAKFFALQWVNNLDTQYRPCTDLFLEGLTTLVTNADDQVTLNSLDNVLAGAIDLEAKKDDVKRKYMELIACAINSTRVSRSELHEIMLDAYREACKPLPTSVSYSPPVPHPAPPSNIGIVNTEAANGINRPCLSPSSPADPAGSQAQSCSAGRWC